MCGRYTLFCSVAELAELVGAKLSERQLSLYRTSHGYNVAPSQRAPIVVSECSARTIVAAQWGFRPAWAGDSAPKPINARAETVFDKPFFRKAAAQGRCLIPSTGWYEWQRVSRTEKRPFFIRPEGKTAFCFAGLFEAADEEPGRTFAIIVGAAARGLASLHPRQPVVVAEEDYAPWLEPDTPRQRLETILRQRSDAYERTAVSRRVGNPRNDDPRLLRE